MKLFSPSDTPENFWQILASAGLVQGDLPAVPAQAHGDSSPWFVKTMLGVAAWLSSLFFLAFLAVLMGSWLDQAGARAFLGIIACVLAVAYFRKGASSIFFEQICFVLALLGQILVLSAILDRYADTTAPWLLATVFEAIALVAIPYQPNRFLSALAALFFLYCVMLSWGLAGLFLPACLIALAVMLHYQWKLPRLAPAVAAALSLVPFCTIETQGHFQRLTWRLEDDPCCGLFMALPIWFWQASLIAAWLGVVHALLQRATAKPFSPENASVWLLALLLAAGTWPVPLSLFALAVFALGFSQRDKLLEGIGIIQLLWATGYYYYALETTLLFKSLLLAALGAALLLLYAASRYLLPKAARGDAA
jgi:hypothetical protein